jgi:hypothetical protein
MRRLISFLLLLLVMSTAFAWAAPPRASVTPVKATHARAHHHHAHKAAKHRTPKRHRAEV